VIRDLCHHDLLVLDDLGAEKTTEFAITTLYIIIDRRIRDAKRTIITTNLSLKEIEDKLDARIASRLSGMQNVKISMPDYRKKR
jgi:DNA replication protein DnaC